jgi:hypothetical protein
MLQHVFSEGPVVMLEGCFHVAHSFMQTIQHYLENTVRPSLRDHHGEFLLKEVKRRWENHKILNEWLRKFFMYLVRATPEL